MEDLLAKIYMNPNQSLQSMSINELNYFYEYFKYEYYFQSHHLSQESFQDKKRLIKIYKKLRKEIIKRCPEII